MGTEITQQLPADSKGLSSNVKQKLWTLAFVLALLKTQLDFSMVREREVGQWKPRGELLFTHR